MASPVRDRLIAGSVVAVVAAMGGLAYASVPLYRLFCAATGYNGTTQVAATAPDAKGRRTLEVRFDSNVAAGLDWSFAPDVPSMRLRTGETATVFYKVTNRAKHETTAVARYTVAPDAAGAWFDKISCFCFAEQTLAAGETMDMPVVFFLDPGLDTDEIMAKVDSVTLSYTFYAVPRPPLSSAAQPEGKKL